MFNIGGYIWHVHRLSDPIRALLSPKSMIESVAPPNHGHQQLKTSNYVAAVSLLQGYLDVDV